MRYVEIKSSRLKPLLLAVCGLMFVVAGIFIVIKSPSKWIGWMSIAFFGATIPVFIWQYRDARPRLIIDESGVNDRTLGVGTILWEDIEGAYIKSISGNDFICLYLKDEDKYLRLLSPIKRAMAKPNAALGFTSLSLNLTGVSASTDQIFELVMKVVEARKR